MGGGVSVWGRKMEGGRREKWQNVKNFESEKGCIGNDYTMLSLFSCSFENLEAKTKRMVHTKFRVFVLGRKVGRMTDSTLLVLF